MASNNSVNFTNSRGTFDENSEALPNNNVSVTMSAEHLDENSKTIPNNNISISTSMGHVDEKSSSTTYNASYAEALIKGNKTSKPPDNAMANSNIPDKSSSKFQNANESSVEEEKSSGTSDERSPKSRESSLLSENHVNDFSEIVEDSVSSEVYSDISNRTLHTSDEVDSHDASLSSKDRLNSPLIVAVNHSDEDDNSLESTSSGTSDEDDESVDEDDDIIGISDAYPSVLKWQLRKNIPKLPETVTVLENPNGSKVYLVGTAHFSVESQEDVAKTIRSTHPDVVMVELCKSRIYILSLDEATVMEESKNMTIGKMRAAIKQNGYVQGILYLLLLNMSAHLTKQLGMAPGGEFRRAFTEAKKVPGCVVHLGDRPIQVTLKRALSTLSFWKKIKMAWYLLMSNETLSKEDVERCKQHDLLEKMLADMTGEFPELSRVFVEERDVYLTYSLQMASSVMPSNVAPEGVIPSVVVGVVGIGHVPGIVAKWNKVHESDIPPILRIPVPTRRSLVIKKTIKYSFYGLLLYGCYRMLGKSIVKFPIKFVSNLIKK